MRVGDVKEMINYRWPYYTHIKIFKGAEYHYSIAKIIVSFRSTWSTLQRLPAVRMISKPNLKKFLQA